MSAEPFTSDEFRPHDLLWLDQASSLISQADIPAWVSTALDRIPVVVVRRGKAADGFVPVGVRGGARNERFAAMAHVRSIDHRIRPEHLLVERCEPDRLRAAAIPALQAFERVAAAWSRIPFAWGPTGSVGFELATGMPTTTTTSDLDLLVRSPARLSRQEAGDLLAALPDIDVRADVQMETPAGCFALREYSTGTAARQVLMRTGSGSRLVSDPWNLE